MKILNQWSTEREGNDSWLKYNLCIIQEWDEISLQLKENHNGWAGPDRTTRSVELDPHDVSEGMLDRICEYISDYADSSEYSFMLDIVTKAIHDLGFERGDLWFELAEQIKIRSKSNESFENTDI